MRVGRFSHAIGYVAGAPAGDPGSGRGHTHGESHQPTQLPAAVAQVLQLLVRMPQPVALSGELTDAQLDSVPAKTNRFAHATGRHWTLRR